MIDASVTTTARWKAEFIIIIDVQKLLLVQSVCEHDALVAGHGKKDTTFQMVLSTFLHMFRVPRETHTINQVWKRFVYTLGLLRVQC